MKNFAYLIVLTLLISGCATSRDVVKGMDKNQVVKVWGRPGRIMTSKNSCCRDTNEEAWLYYGEGLKILEPKRSIVFEDDTVETVYMRELIR